MTVLLLACLLACAEAPKELHLEVHSSNLPMTRPDQPQPQPSPPASELPTVQGNGLGSQGIQRRTPWQLGPEYPLGPGRAWPSSWPAGPYW